MEFSSSFTRPADQLRTKTTPDARKTLALQSRRTDLLALTKTWVHRQHWEQKSSTQMNNGKRLHSGAALQRAAGHPLWAACPDGLRHIISCYAAS